MSSNTVGPNKSIAYIMLCINAHRIKEVELIDEEKNFDMIIDNKLKLSP